MTVIQTKPNQPRRNNSSCDLSESGQRADINRSRETEDRMVPQVEDIHAETKIVAVLDVEPLDQREVRVLLEWTTKIIAWHIAKTGCSRRAGRDESRGSEARGVQIELQ